MTHSARAQIMVIGTLESKPSSYPHLSPFSVDGQCHEESYRRDEENRGLKIRFHTNKSREKQK